MGADNQQERLDNNWIVGFTDGEGCFHVAINRQPKMTSGWQVLPEFRIVQHKRDLDVLKQIQKHLDLGHVVRNHGDRFELRIRGLKNLQNLISFFKRYPLQTIKKQSFEKFAEVISMIERKEHLSKEGLDKIAHISSNMNRKVKPVYLESSETLCQTSLR